MIYSDCIYLKEMKYDMATKIEWCEETWNVVTGCTPVSEGCQNCYAKRMANRLRGRFGYPEDEPFRVTLHPDKLEQPLKWKKPRKIFVCSMGDLFHEDVPFMFITNIMGVINACKHHTFIILTKRPDNIINYLDWLNKLAGKESLSTGWPFPNVWLGVTAENQEATDKRIPILLQIPAKVRFVSVEPMVGPVRLKTERDLINPNDICLDWVIAGAESGPGARPMQIEWARDLRDQCVNANVPFFLKQMNIDGRLVKMPKLDGKEWSEYPDARKGVL